MSEEAVKIQFALEDGSEIELEVIEQTKINGINYLLVAEGEDVEEENAFLLKEIVTEKEELIYDAVEDENEIEAISKVFSELLEDVDIKY